MLAFRHANFGGLVVLAQFHVPCGVCRGELISPCVLPLFYPWAVGNLTYVGFVIFMCVLIYFRKPAQVLLVSTEVPKWSYPGLGFGASLEFFANLDRILERKMGGDLLLAKWWLFKEIPVICLCRLYEIRFPFKPRWIMAHANLIRIWSLSNSEWYLQVRIQKSSVGMKVFEITEIAAQCLAA